MFTEEGGPRGKEKKKGVKTYSKKRKIGEYSMVRTREATKSQPGKKE